MTISSILTELRQAARHADRKAALACAKSKYSVQDFWMCMEFWTQRLHDRIAKKVGLKLICPHYPFRQQLTRFKKGLTQRR